MRPNDKQSTKPGSRQLVADHSRAGSTSFTTADAASTTISIRGLSKAFGDTVALHPLDLEIERGEFVTLLGPSGCGKTTLLRMLAGLELPSAGDIYNQGKNITTAPPERRPFNMVFQSYALFPHMTVFDNIAYGLRTAGRPDAVVRERVRGALDLVGLTKFADSRVQQLSGGMSQRVALVRAIVNEPDVLLLDEPLGALDLQLRKQMQLELRAIQHRIGTTFIYVTHDQEEALVMSHRVVLMQHGRVVQVGTPSTVYHQPVNRFAAEFVGTASLLPCRVSEVVNTGQVAVRFPGGGGGTFPSFGPDPIRRDEDGLVALRPEHVRLCGPDDGQLTGTVKDTMFIGARSHIILQMSDGTELRIEADNDRLSTGDFVGIRIIDGKGAYVANESAERSPVE